MGKIHNIDAEMFAKTKLFLEQEISQEPDLLKLILVMKVKNRIHEERNNVRNRTKENSERIFLVFTSTPFLGLLPFL